MAEFIAHCWNDKPDVALIGMRAAGRQSERWIGKQLAGLLEDAPVCHGMATLRGQLAPLTPPEEGVSGGPSSPSPSEPVPILEQAQMSTFTRREVVVLSHLTTGLTSDEIAGSLGVSHETTENHTRRMSSTLEVQSRTHAMSVALQRCVLDQTCALVNQSGRSLPSA